MSRDLILHIGTSKTGSTSIQRVLSRQRPAMLAQGVAYPRSPGFERHSVMAWACIADRRRVDNPDRKVWKGVSPEARIAKFREEFDAEMRALPPEVRRVVLSAEEFSMRLLDRQSVQNLHDLLQPHFASMQVVVWLRRPDQHFASLYSQMLRWGDPQPPGLIDADPPPAHGYDFDGLLDRWASVFGETNVKPQLFERLSGKKLDVVADFIQLCGLELEIPARGKASVANESLSHPAQEMLVELAGKLRGKQKKNVTSPIWRHLVDAASSSVPGRSWQPTREEAAAFNARYATNHEAVRQRWFPERTTLFVEDYADLPETPPVVDDKTRLDASLAMITALGEEAARLESQIALLGEPKRAKRADRKRVEKP